MVNRGKAMEMALHEALMWVGTLVAMSSYHQKSRHSILIFGLVAQIFYVVYAYYAGAMAGFMIMSIAFFAKVTQALIPERHLAKTFYLRNGIALLGIILGLCFIYETPSDLYPLIGFIFGRISEAQSCTQKMRFSCMASNTAWILYAVEMGLFAFFISNLIFAASLLLSVWNHEQERKKTVLIPATAS